MVNFLLVQIGQPLGDVQTELNFLRQGDLGGDGSAEIAARLAVMPVGVHDPRKAVLHEDVDVAFGLDILVELDDILVVGLGLQDINLPLEVFEVVLLGLLRIMVFEDLSYRAPTLVSTVALLMTLQAKARCMQVSYPKKVFAKFPSPMSLSVMTIRPFWKIF